MQREQSQAVSTDPQWQDQRQWAQTETQGGSSWTSGNTVMVNWAQVAQGGFWVSITGFNQKPSGHWPGQPVLGLAVLQQPQALSPHILSRAPPGVHIRCSSSSRIFGVLFELWHRGEQQLWALSKGSLFQQSSFKQGGFTIWQPDISSNFNLSVIL